MADRAQELKQLLPFVNIYAQKLARPLHTRRFAAWQSLAGLTRSPQGQSVEEVAALVQRCSWASFETDGGWFYQIAWDLGLVALLPDGMSLTVLAATDTD